MQVPESGGRSVRYQLVTASRLALDSIRAHKMRSFLTLLGVIIGVASVVLVGAAIEGLGVYAEESTSKVFGSESYLVAQIAGAMSRKEYFAKLQAQSPHTARGPALSGGHNRAGNPLQRLQSAHRRREARELHLRRR